jgi:hypothetical protein
MSAEQWEALCDGCGRCCLVKLEDEDTGKVFFTDVGCTLLDGRTCRCGNYRDRQEIVGDCLKLEPGNLGDLGWLPPTCAYRLLAAGEGLPWWHPLVSGDPETVHQVGVSVRNRLSANEDQVPVDSLVDHIVQWPARWPRMAKRRAGTAVD